MKPIAHIVDDDEAIRDALTWLFRSRQVDSRAWSSAEAFLADWRENLRGCLVLDLRMEGMSGLQLFDLLCERGSRLPVIFLSGHGDIPLAVAAVKKGAFDFVEKPFNDNVLVDRVIRAMESDAARKEPAPGAAAVQARLAQLTPREREVMERILAGKYNKIIADELDIAMRTVEVHRSRIFEKMGVKSAVELAQLLSGNR
ncbi:MAG: Response regulator protein TmoT [Rhodocyclaceae bacterium]|nr:MAG: response regulator transcription factor [Rhodocyclaceae bacterium]MBE7421546.1 response regulator transcription factor [Zoogloeaceae bacterium]MBV6408784.1 Response regulator protein TmoT [Rhodocyclaceae bacterium]MCK6385423.1 response regulator [Rhodocyclaceae bacterium]CAG0932648.1 Response regulator protein TmoT [Rhodocyclaceae bacterium]